ncbi:MAG: S16 family serine protease [Candidatus Micrarchaeota archaeon]
MDRKLMLLLALLLVFAFSAPVHAECPDEERIVYIPAVVSGQEGGLLRVKVETMPGNGSVFTSIDPLVGVSTQLSQQEAVREGFANTGVSKKECEILFSFLDLNQSPSVDGPSAGLAMTIALKAALEGKELRKDIAITGAILQNGQVGLVGGLIDKAQASAREGKVILITPKQKIYENILLSKLAEEHEFVAIEVETLEQGYEIATSAEGKEYESNFKLENKQIPANLPQRELNEDDMRFSEVAGNINNELLLQVREGSGEGLEEYEEHFEKEAGQNNEIIEKGYAYTAANNAFLSQIDAYFLATPPHELNLEKEIEISGQCVDALPSVEITEENFEWIAGAEARKSWAKKKIEDISKYMEDFQTQEERYLAAREIYYARSWCQAAGHMLAQAEEIGGEEIDNEILKSVAKVKLIDARKLVENSIVRDNDAIWHLDTANNSLESGEYGGAIFDCAYASGMQIATNHESEEEIEEIGNMTLEIADMEFESLWGRIYNSQGVYGAYSAIEGGGNIVESYRVFRLSDEMEKSMLMAKAKIKNPPIAFEVSKKEEKVGKENAAISIFALLCILILSLNAGMKAIKKGL